MATETARSHALPVDRTDLGALLGLGFGVWLVATVTTRLFGPVLLSPATPAVTAAVYLLMLPSMAALALAVFRLLGITGAARAPAAVVLSLPGMALDSLVLPAFPAVFPAVDGSMAGAFGGILLVAYATVLVTGLLTA